MGMSYLAMHAYFDRADVGLPGFAKWAHENSNEEKGHAEKLIEYLNKRGGHYIPQDFLESEYLPGQVNAINEISTLMRKLMRAGPGRPGCLRLRTRCSRRSSTHVDNHMMRRPKSSK